MNRGLSSIFVLSSLIFLAGCTISVNLPNPFPDAIVRSVSDDPDTFVAQGNLDPGESIVYEMRLSSSQMSQQAVYFELGNNLNLYVYSSQGTLYAASSSPTRFHAGTAGAQGVGSEGYRRTGIGPTQTCDGSCIIHDAESSRLFVEIENPSGSLTQPYGMFAYVDSYDDLGEFENDTSGSALPISLGGSESGAIESIGDVDYYRASANGNLLFTAPVGIDVRANIIIEGGDPLPVENGVPRGVFAGDLILVNAAGNDTAAVSASSEYFLELSSSSP
jgi:hypothetical protein